MASSNLGWIRKNLDFTILSLSILVSILYALQLEGWNQPYISDRTFHLYSAQMIAKGAIPYVDFFNVHPPLGIMLTALPMYLFPDLQVGTGPAVVHSVLTMIWSFCAITALYFMAKSITGTWVGGLLCVSFWMYLTPLFIRHYSIGQNRLLVISCILISMALLQKKKWYWTGFLLAMGFMTYYPTALAGVAVIFVIIGQKTWRDRLETSALFLAGFVTVTGMILIWLSYKGAFVAWFDVTMRWPFAFGEVASHNIQKSLLNFLMHSNMSLKNTIANGYKFWDINLIWIPIGGVIGYFYFIFRQIFKTNNRVILLLFSEKIAPVFITTFMFYLYLLVEKGPLDPLIFESFLTIWISLLLIELISLIKNISFIGYCSSLLLIFLTMSFFSFRLFNTVTTLFDKGMHPMWRNGYLEYDNSAYLQAEAGKKLLNIYPEDKKILVLGDLWFLNVTNRDNQSRFYHTGPKMRLAAKLAGYATPENNMWDQLTTLNSDLILVTKYRYGAYYNIITERLAEMDYACVGEASDVFIIIPREDGYALPTLFKTQQVFSNSQLPDDFDGIEIIDADDVSQIANLEINEIVPGTLLLGYQIDSQMPKSVILYWWNWLDVEDQLTDIFIETELNNHIVSSQLLNSPRFPKKQVFKQVIELPDIKNFTEKGKLIISYDEIKNKFFPCKSDFTVGHVTIPLEQ